MVESIYNTEKTLEIALVGKYVALRDAYLSVAEALNHAGIANKAKVNIHWIDSETLEDPKLTMEEVFKGIDGIVVPGASETAASKVKSALSSMPVKIRFPILLMPGDAVCRYGICPQRRRPRRGYVVGIL